jgi:hypothetical protein
VAQFPILAGKQGFLTAKLVQNASILRQAMQQRLFNPAHAPHYGSGK